MSDVRFDPLGLNKQDFVRRIQNAGLDAVLLTSPENVYYATGYPALPSSGNPILYALRNVLPFFAFVTADGFVTLLCWGGAAAGVDYGVDEVKTFADIQESYQALSAVVNAQRAGKPSFRLGLESSCPFSVVEMLEDSSDIKHTAIVDDLMMMTRFVKSPQEVALLEKSIAIVEQTVSELMDEMHPGIARPGLMQAAKTGMMRHGASGISHVTISFGASNPEVEIDEQLQPNKLVTLDLGAIVHGYYSDNRRLMFTGSIPPAMTALHLTMCDIVDQVAAELAPGKTIGDIYAVAMKLYALHNLKPFIPNIGHTIGLQVEEVWFYPGNAALVLEPGVVLNLEMYAVYTTGELIGDEETYVVTETGARQLTRLPTAIRQVAS